MTELERKPHVYLSYAARDDEVASVVSRALTEAGCAVFSAASSTRLSAGQDLLATIREAMKETDAMVLIASSESVNSGWTAFELGAAMAWGKPVYAVASSGAPLPLYLQHTHVVSISELDDLARALIREGEPLPEAERKILSAVYVDIGVPSDQLLSEPAAANRLVREFNRRSRGNASLNRLNRELLRLRKLGRLPRIGRNRQSSRRRSA